MIYKTLKHLGPIVAGAGAGAKLIASSPLWWVALIVGVVAFGVGYIKTDS